MKYVEHIIMIKGPLSDEERIAISTEGNKLAENEIENNRPPISETGSKILFQRILSTL